MSVGSSDEEQVAVAAADPHDHRIPGVAILDPLLPVVPELLCTARSRTQPAPREAKAANAALRAEREAEAANAPLRAEREHREQCTICASERSAVAGPWYITRASRARRSTQSALRSTSCLHHRRRLLTRPSPAKPVGEHANDDAAHT